MHCPSCGTEVRPGQKFCAECGTSLRGISDVTGEVPVIRSQDSASEGVQDEVTRVMGRIPDDQAGRASAEPGRAAGWDRPLPPPDSPFGAPTPGAPASDWAATSSAAGPPGAGARASGTDDQHHEHADTEHDDDTTVIDPLLRRAAEIRGGGQTAEEGFYGDQSPWTTDPERTTQLPAHDNWGVTAAPVAATADRTQVYARTPGAHATPGAHTPPSATGARTPVASPVHDHEYVYDSHDPWEDEWVADEPTGREFRFRVLFALAVLAAAATVVGVLSLLIEISPEGAAAAPFDNGTWMVNDFGTNNTVAALIAAGAVLVGAFLWCFGFRWGAGLAGGGGLALAGWVALIIGLAEWPIHQAELAADTVPATITREFGYWSLVGAAGLGLLVFCFSLAGSGRDRQGGLDPWIAALGAAAFLVAAGGPLIPQGSADISGNYSSDTLGVDLPTMFFAGRLVQVGLLALAGIVGFLLVRRYGLGLAIGGGTAAGFMVATAATDSTDAPIGPAFANPGAIDLAPHGVTVVALALAGFFALVAVVMALLDSKP